ncbi:MAG TPA: 50S ribosomal protein L4 [Rhodospirillales bacterium]|nr:50S ribosomal protein L4 [Rhodospirillales bacterium]
MQVPVRNLAGEEVGSVELDEAVFGVPVRVDILHRVVEWQRAKRRAGTHKVKGRSEVARTKQKMYRQKGTGRARHGARSANIFVGGGRAFGPVPRSHAYDLPKKVRRLGLKCALAGKLKEGRLMVLDKAALEEPRTKLLAERLAGLGLSSAIFVTGGEPERNFVLASRNLPGVSVLPQMGANVYDILRHDTLVLTEDAVQLLQERLR